MRRVTAAAVAAAFTIATVGVFAQAKPSFAGKWTREAPAADAGAAGGGGGGRGGRGGGGGFGQEPTITQDAKTLTIEYTQGQNPLKLTYTIDGESKNTMPGRGGGEPQVLTSKTAWVGSTLVITTTLANGGERKQVLSLDGGKLVVETTQPGRDGGPGTPTKVTYTKGA